MNKPEWKDAPEWANYLAMDDNYQWYWFEKKPELKSYWWACKPADSIKLAALPLNWKESLEQRPKG